MSYIHLEYTVYSMHILGLGRMHCRNPEISLTSMEKDFFERLEIPQGNGCSI